MVDENPTATAVWSFMTIYPFALKMFEVLAKLQITVDAGIYQTAKA